MRKILVLAVLFIVVSFSFFYFGNQIANAAKSSICWDCISEKGVDYRCLGAYEGFENCGQTNPYDCILTGPGCNVSVE